MLHSLVRVLKVSVPIRSDIGSKVNAICNGCIKGSTRNLSRSSSFSKSEAPDLDELRAVGLAKPTAEQIIKSEFKHCFRDGEFVPRLTHVDFCDQALDKFEELGIHKDLEAYKTLLKVFPPGRYAPKSYVDFGWFNPSQQMCAIKILHKADTYRVIPDKETEKIVVAAFGKTSKVWLKVCRMNYWFMKGRNIDKYALPEVLPEKPHELAKLALQRISDDPKTVITVRNTSLLTDSVDQTWVVYMQSPQQQSLIGRLDKNSMVYIEESGTIFVRDKHLSYFTMKVYETEEQTKKRSELKTPKPDFNYNTLKMKFYGKPIEDKIREPDEQYRIDNYHLLGIAMTGTSSADSALSWLKLMQLRNPNLANVTVLFKMKRKPLDPPVPLTDLRHHEQAESAAH